MPVPDVVAVDGVSKRFVIRRDKSLKERVVNFRRGARAREEFWALRDVGLTIPLGETVGLVGANGSGKSTLLKVIGGIIQPTSGQVTRRGRLAALLELGAGFHPDLTGRENVYLNAAILGLSRKQTDRHFEAIVDFSGIERFIDQQVKFYSSGMYVRLAFAVAVHVDPDILLVDEVLAVGDEPFQRKCLDRIRLFQREGRTIVMVSHALDQVAELCDRAVVLDSGQVIADGDPRTALRVLRDDYAETTAREAETAARKVDPEHAAPVRRAEITQVRLVGRGGAAPVIVPGGGLRVDVEVAAPAALEDWVVGIGIETVTGQNVFGTNTEMLGIPLPTLRSTTTVSLEVDELWLGEGSYTISAALAHEGGGEIHRVQPGPGFSVRTERRDAVGVVHARTSVVGGT